MLRNIALHSEWILVFAPALMLGLAVLVVWARRIQLRADAQSHEERALARERGSDVARLQHPDIDLSQCIGCGACVRACPEEGVLSLIHGQAVVVHGARCVGHGLCAAACPTGAIALTLGDLSQRKDLPALTNEFETVGTPGLFLAGEISGFALVRTAIAQGVAAADAVARRIAACPHPARRRALVGVGGPAAKPEHEEALDLLVVGAGPGGIACSLRALECGLSFETIEQEQHIGGTVAAYPRRKMVMTQPVELPLHGRFSKTTYEKEELIEIWHRLQSQHQLPIRTGVQLLDLARGGDGVFIATTSQQTLRARHVCLALGRRGTPRKLGVPGEGLPKVAYSLIDAESYRNRRILVVGGGDSAIEAALGLAEQPGNRVVISYRKAAFFRLKARNQTRIDRAIHSGQILSLFGSSVLEIKPDSVVINGADGVGELPNDEVFILAGGDPPFALLERAGVSFDPKDRPHTIGAQREAPLLSVLTLAFLCALVLTIWGIWFQRYYSLAHDERAASSLHGLLRASGPVGLWFGIGTCVLVAWNLAYLLRRSPRLGGWLPGSLRTWMGAHVFTGLASALCVIMHAGFSYRPTVGGHAFLALTILVGTGCVGRYLYAFIPRAANGTEANLDDLRSQLAALSTEWDRDGRGFGTRVREQVDRLIADNRWRPGWLARIGGLIAGQYRLRRSLRQLRRSGRREGIPEREIRQVHMMARRAYQLTLLVTHYEEIRAALSSWRYFHRWVALLMVMLAAIHIATAARYASLDLGLPRSAVEARR